MRPILLSQKAGERPEKSRRFDYAGPKANGIVLVLLHEPEKFAPLQSVTQKGGKFDSKRLTDDQEFSHGLAGFGDSNFFSDG
jgi:hypothetical protein